jgi:hypothetical protein
MQVRNFEGCDWLINPTTNIAFDWYRTLWRINFSKVPYSADRLQRMVVKNRMKFIFVILGYHKAEFTDLSQEW